MRELVNLALILGGMGLSFGLLAAVVVARHFGREDRG